MAGIGEGALRRHGPDRRPAWSAAVNHLCRYALVVASLLSCCLLFAPAEAAMDPTEAAKHPGARVFKAKNCMACHKWHGEGGTGYGATSVNLRETILNREQLIEVISCGRPGTSMPRHLKVAYDGFACYGGMTAAELGQDLPVRAKQYASKSDINAVAEFIHDFFKGRLQVEKGDCEVFFGVGARTCGNIELPRAGGGH